MASVAVQVLESGMLVCFGISWPVDIINTLRVRQSGGKSFAFMVLIAIGYACGIASKVLRAEGLHRNLEWVTWLYVVNLVLVLIDISISRHYRTKAKV